MLSYSRALKMLREAGLRRLDMGKGMTIEGGSGHGGIVVCYNGCPVLVIGEGSTYEFYTEHMIQTPEEYILVGNKFGPKIGLHMSPRGYVAFNRGALRNNMIFNRLGKIIQDGRPEDSYTRAVDPNRDDPEYLSIFSDDDEQPKKEKPSEQEASRPRARPERVEW